MAYGLSRKCGFGPLYLAIPSPLAMSFQGLVLPEESAVPFALTISRPCGRAWVGESDFTAPNKYSISALGVPLIADPPWMVWQLPTEAPMTLFVKLHRVMRHYLLARRDCIRVLSKVCSCISLPAGRPAGGGRAGP